MTGIPITNVNNNCSTGSTALYNASNLIRGGLADCVLALGFERMARGSLGTNFPDRESPVKVFNDASAELEESLSAGQNHGPGAPRMFANGAQEYFDKYGANIRHLAQIGEQITSNSCRWACRYLYAPKTASKNHKHSVNNPYSQFRDGWSVEQVLAAPTINKQLTKFMCSPTSVRLVPRRPYYSRANSYQDGAACNIVASEDFVRKHGLENQAIEIVAQALTTDEPITFESKSAMEVVGYGMSKKAADQVFAQAGLHGRAGRDQVGVVELHDCFAANEVCVLRRTLCEQFLTQPM